MHAYMLNTYSFILLSFLCLVNSFIVKFGLNYRAGLVLVVRTSAIKTSSSS